MESLQIVCRINSRSYAEENYVVHAKQSNSVVCTDIPVTRKFIKKQFFDDQDLKDFRQELKLYCSALSNYGSTAFYTFDQVLDSEQDRFYQKVVKQQVQKFLEGTSACVLLFGPTGSGKTFTLQGNAGSSKGILPRAVSDVLTQMGNIKIQIYLIYSSKVQELRSQDITSLDDFYDLWHQVSQNIVDIGQKSNQEKIEKCSHLVVKLDDRLSFVKLAGSEQSALDNQFISQSFNSLSDHILHINQGKRRRYTSEILIDFLGDTAKQNLVLVGCCDPCSKHSLPSLKFCARIREKTLRKSQNFEIPQCYFNSDVKLNDYLNKLHSKLTNLKHITNITDTDYSWCIQNLEVCSKALFDSIRNKDQGMQDSLNYYKRLLQQVQSRYESGLMLRSKEKNHSGRNRYLQDSGSPLRSKERKNEVLDWQNKNAASSNPLSDLPQTIRFTTAYDVSKKMNIDSQFETTDQALSDLKRLLYLDDSTGVKQKFLTVINQRNQLDDQLHTQKLQILELNSQSEKQQIQQKLNEQKYERKIQLLLVQIRESQDQSEIIQKETISQCNSQIRSWEQQYEDRKKQWEQQVASQERKMDQIIEQSKSQKQNYELRIQELETQIQIQKDENTKSEIKCSEQQGINEKLKIQYEVIKQHEIQSVQHYTQRISDLEKLNADAQRSNEFKVAERDKQIQELGSQVKDLEDFIRQLNHEIARLVDREKVFQGQIQVLECRVERLQRDNEDCISRISNLNKDVMVRDDQVKVANQSVLDAQNLAQDQKQIYHQLDNQLKQSCLDLRDRDQKIRLLQEEVTNLKESQQVADECIRLKTNDFNTVQSQLDEVLQANQQLDRQVIRLKAQAIDNDSDTRKSVDLEQTVKNLRNELSEMHKQLLQAKSREIELQQKLACDVGSAKKQHEQSLTQYDVKFYELNKQISLLQDRNQQMADNEVTLQRMTHLLELEVSEWRDKCKLLERRTFLAPKEEEKVDDVRESLGDIQSLISNFRSKRENLNNVRQFKV